MGRLATWLHCHGCDVIGLHEQANLNKILSVIMDTVNGNKVQMTPVKLLAGGTGHVSFLFLTGHEDSTKHRPDEEIERTQRTHVP
jgi:hypothetical protein